MGIAQPIRMTRKSSQTMYRFKSIGAAIARHIRADDDDGDGGYEDFEVRLSTDFRRPLWGDYYETLDHSAGAIMRDFVDRGMAYVQVRGHWSGDAPGRILEKSLKTQKDGDLTVLTATVRMVDDGMAGTAQIRRWKAGVDRNLSIDYEWREWEIHESTDNDDRDTDIIVKSWRLRGVSVVTDPADEEVGVMGDGAREQLESEMKRILKGARRMRREDTPDPNANPEPNADPNPGNRAPADPPPADPPANPPEPGTRTDQPKPKDPATIVRENLEAIDEEFTSTLKSLRDKGKTIEGPLEREVEECKSLARAIVLRGGDHTPGTLTQEIFKRIAFAADPKPAVADAIRIDNDGNPVQDGTRNVLVCAMADAYGHLQKSRGPAHLFSRGVIDVAIGDKHTRNAGAALEFQEALLGAMDPSVRNVLGNAPGCMITPDMYLRMQAANENASPEVRKKSQKALRAFTVTQDSGGKGGNLVQTDVLVEEFVDALYASAHTDMLGCRTLMGLSSKIQFPVQTSKLAEAWRTEIEAYTLSDATIGAVTAEPHRLVAGADITFQLAIQVGGAVDDIVLGILQASLDEEIDNSVLNGAASGSDPTGILNTTGISTTNVPLATAGRAARYENMLTAKNKLLTSDVPMANVRASVAAEAVGLLQATPQDTTGGSGRFVMNGDELVDVPAYSTTLLSGDTQNDEFCIFGDWVKSVICQFGMPILTEDPYTQAASGQKRVIINCYHDHIVTQAARFAEAVANTVN